MWFQVESDAQPLAMTVSVCSPAPELRRLRHGDQLLRERRAHGGLHGPDAIDLNLQRVRRLPGSAR